MFAELAPSFKSPMSNQEDKIDNISSHSTDNSSEEDEGKPLEYLKMHHDNGGYLNMNLPEEKPCPIQYYKKNLKNIILFDAVGIQFHFRIFCEQLFAHIFLPALFFVKNPSAQGIRPEPIPIWYNILAPIFFYIMIICYVTSSEYDFAIINQVFWMPALFFISHRLILSLKYASLSETEYERFNDCKDPELATYYREQMQLFTGWVNLDAPVLFFELGAASSRIGVRINEIFLVLGSKNCKLSEDGLSQLRYWNAFIRGHEYIDLSSQLAPEIKTLKNGKVVISVYDMCLAVIRRANNYDKTPRSSFFSILILVSIIILLSFSPLMFSHHDKLNNIPLITIFYFCSTFLTWYFGRVFFYLLYVAIIDVKRTLKMVQILHCMIRLTDLMIYSNLSLGGMVNECLHELAKARIDEILSINEALDCQACEKAESSQERKSDILGNRLAKNYGYASVPRLSFEHPANVLAWTYARLTIQNFGDRFRYRTDIYVGCSLALMVIMMILEIITLIFAEDRLKTFLAPLYIQSLIVIFLLCLFLVLLTQLGTCVNDELNIQKRTLSARILKMKLNSMKISSENDSEILNDDSTEILSLALETLDINTELKPYKILGFEAQSALTMTIFTTIISFISVLVSLLFGNQTASSFL